MHFQTGRLPSEQEGVRQVWQSAVKDFGSDVKLAFEQLTGGAENAKAKMKTTVGGIIQFFLNMQDPGNYAGRSNHGRLR